MKLFSVAFLATILSFSCDQNQLQNQKDEDPPGGWTSRVNNRLIGRVAIGQNNNCAYSSGRNILCFTDTLETQCFLTVSFMDGRPKEKWEKGCLDLTPLMFDDGTPQLLLRNQDQSLGRINSSTNS